MSINASCVTLNQILSIYFCIITWTNIF